MVSIHPVSSTWLSTRPLFFVLPPPANSLHCMMKIPGPNVICSTSMMQRRTSISGPPTQFYCSLCCCLNTFTQPVGVGLVWCQWELGNKNWQLVMSLNDTPTQRAEVRWRHMRMIFVEEISIAAIIQCSYNQCSISSIITLSKERLLREK